MTQKIKQQAASVQPPETIITTSQAPAPATPEEPLLTGGPGPMEVLVTTEPVVEKPAEPLFKYGDKVFQTQEELAAFITDIDKKASKNQGYEEALAKLQAVAQAPAEPKPVAKAEPEGEEALIIDGQNVAELLWENPGKALALLKKEAVREADRTVETRQTTQRSYEKVWADFYAKNKDLEDCDDMVQVMYQKNRNELNAMPTTEALDKLASLTRGELKRIHEKFQPSEVLPNAPAKTAGTSGAIVPAMSAPVVTKNVAFTDQVRQLQSKFTTM